MRLPFSGKKLQWFNKLCGANPKERAKEIKKLRKKGDIESIKALYELANRVKDPLCIEALLKINNPDPLNGSLVGLRRIYFWAKQWDKGTTWKDLIEKAFIDLRDYYVCSKIMFDETSNYKDNVELREFVENHPEFAKIIEGYPSYFRRPFANKYPPYHISEMDRYMLPRQSQETIKKLIAYVEKEIEEINKDQDYYMEYQPFGDETNYDWDKAREPREKYLKYLRTYLK